MKIDLGVECLLGVASLHPIYELLTTLPRPVKNVWRTRKVTMNESEFIYQIDCNFPYHDRQEASHLIDLACQLSPNAAFMVAYELRRPPHGKKNKLNQMMLLDMLNELDEKFEHPIKPMIFSICRKLIQGQHVTGAEALIALDHLKDYPDQYNAAAIAYFSCDDEMQMEQVDQQYQSLIQSWKSRGV